MPVKWKIFFGLNLALAISSLIFLALLIINSINSIQAGEETFYFILFITALFVMTLNGFLNIFLLQRFYPDNSIPAGVKGLNLVSWILTTLTTIGLMLVCYYAAPEVFNERNKGRDTGGKIAFIILLFVLIIQATVLIMQVQLPRLIKRNNRDRMHSLIDSIGQ